MIEQVKNGLVQGGAGWVLWLLIGLSVVSVAVMLDRARVFWAQRQDIAVLVSALDRLLGERDIEGAHRCLVRSRSAAALVVLAGLAHVDRGTAAAQQAMSAALGLHRTRLERRLLVLGTIGSNAPFIGLLGTVIGVVGAFDALGSAGAVAASTATQLAPERVMRTIAEALVATAAGLVVAIPAVAVFNYFQGLLSAAMNDADTLGHVLLSHFDTLGPARVAADAHVSSTHKGA